MALADSPSNIDQILAMPQMPKRDCPVGTSCGLCANCRERARTKLADATIKAQRDQRRSTQPGGPSWGRATRRLSTVLEMLELDTQDPKKR